MAGHLFRDMPATVLCARYIVKKDARSSGETKKISMNLGLVISVGMPGVLSAPSSSRRSDNNALELLGPG